MRNAILLHERVKSGLEQNSTHFMHISNHPLAIPLLLGIKLFLLLPVCPVKTSILFQ